MTAIHGLPAANGLDIRSLEKTLDKTATSLKFLWVLALLKILAERDSSRVEFREVSSEMIRMAAPLLYKYRLYFGKIDNMKGLLKEVCPGAFFTGEEPDLSDDALARDSFRKMFGEIEKHAPYRLLTPFFETDLRGMEDSKKIGEIQRLAKERFDGRSPPPYKFEEELGRKFIRMHPDWNRYFFNNMGVLRGWAMWHWADFLQDRNPSVPAIIKKINPDVADTQMTEQKKFWRDVIRHDDGQIVCIYSGERIGHKEYDIVPYLPWSLTGHCHLWNLSPAKKEVRRSKGERIPHGRYLDNLVDAQYNAMNIRMKHFPNEWDELIDSYRADLHLSDTDLTNRDALRSAYSRVVPSTINIAASKEFPTDWTWGSQSHRS